MFWRSFWAPTKPLNSHSSFGCAVVTALDISAFLWFRSAAKRLTCLWLWVCVCVCMCVCVCECVGVCLSWRETMRMQMKVNLRKRSCVCMYLLCRGSNHDNDDDDDGAKSFSSYRLESKQIFKKGSSIDLHWLWPTFSIRPPALERQKERKNWLYIKVEVYRFCRFFTLVIDRLFCTVSPRPAAYVLYRLYLVHHGAYFN